MPEQSDISIAVSWVAMDAAIMIHKPLNTSSHNIYSTDWQHFLDILEGQTGTP